MRRTKFYSLLSLLIVAAFAGFAQPGGGRPPSPPCPNPPCNPVPITGIEVLISMGALLGLRALTKRKTHD